MKYTPEPWNIRGRFETLFGFPIVEFQTKDAKGIGRTTAWEDARRIVACVNACAGVDIDRLESEDWHVLMVKTDDRSAYPSKGLYLVAEVQKE